MKKQQATNNQSEGKTPHSSEKDKIAKGLKRWGNHAYTQTQTSGNAATVLRGNKICQVLNKQVRVVSEVPQSRYKIVQRSFKIKKG